MPDTSDPASPSHSIEPPQEGDDRKLLLYPYSRGRPAIRPAEAKRQWMDDSPQSYAYRCLPLTIANTHGWEILCGRSFSAIWNGGPAKQDVELTFDPNEPKPDDVVVTPMSHFGVGTITFELGMLFQTPPGWNLMIMGPLNAPKDGVSALAGVIETDWSPYTFTMNWKLTRPGLKVSFQQGEPIAHLMPMQRDSVTRFQPEIRQFWSNVDLANRNAEWSKSRTEFSEGLRTHEQKAVAEKWQKAYYRGNQPDGSAGPPDHQIKLRVADFADKRPGAAAVGGTKPTQE